MELKGGFSRPSLEPPEIIINQAPFQQNSPWSTNPGLALDGLSKHTAKSESKGWNLSFLIQLLFWEYTQFSDNPYLIGLTFLLVIYEIPRETNFFVG